MRIVGGKHKGRPLITPKGQTTRPTSDRARESVFNVLAHGIEGVQIIGARVCDIFAGTGALGLEALSRGAVSCIFIENEKSALMVLEQNINALGEQKTTTLIRANALKAPAPPGGAVDIAFLDAPYNRGLTLPTLEHLATNGWFRPAGIVIVEIANNEQFQPPGAFTVIKEKPTGRARNVFIRYMP